MWENIERIKFIFHCESRVTTSTEFACFNHDMPTQAPAK